MSQSEEETSGTESPFLKSRTVTRNESSSEEYESDQEESGDENEQQQSDTEESEVVQAKPPTVSIPQSAPKPNIEPRAPRPTVKSKSYDVMILDAMNALDENKKSGVSIRSVSKYVQDNMPVPENFKMFMFKKAVDKALSKDMFVHTSGTGMAGSIAFSAAHKKTKKLQQAKEMKAAEKKAKTEAKAKAKAETAKAKPKTTKAAAKPKPKDKNNNPSEKLADSKNTTVKGKKARLSVSLLPTLKAKAKPKPKAAVKSETEAPKTTTTKEVKKAGVDATEQSTKGRAKAGPPKAATTKGKAANSKK
ncbi:histone H1 [Aedes albopictus]|uniref:H15 domain-containing protein n=1 Tax=Aedes albopictus TaxID=7160 RepID=A0ABM1YFQ2_AEDAL|nr:histone H1-like [Aedes albopictus]